MTPKQMISLLDGQLTDAYDEIARLTLALSTARNDTLDEAASRILKTQLGSSVRASDWMNGNNSAVRGGCGVLCCIEG